jgi:hypothetical protein
MLLAAVAFRKLCFWTPAASTVHIQQGCLEIALLLYAVAEAITL